MPPQHACPGIPHWVQEPPTQVPWPPPQLVPGGTHLPPAQQPASAQAVPQHASPGLPQRRQVPFTHWDCDSLHVPPQHN